MVPPVVGRVLLFAAWALVGAVASYGFLYAATPYGLTILGTCLFAGLALPEAGRRSELALPHFDRAERSDARQTGR